MTTKTIESNKHYVCTRPSLAGILMECGYTATQTTNPYDPKRKAWIFKGADARLSAIVSDYYGKIKSNKKEGPHHEN